MHKKYINGSNNCYVTEDGHVIGTQGRILKHGLSNGYPTVVICYKDGSKKSRAVHRLVAKSFLPPPSKEILEDSRTKGARVPVVNHIDGNKLNNHYTNLEWCTYKQNYDHAIENGLNTLRKGEDSNFSKIDENTVHAICKMMAEGARTVDICKKLNVTRSTVYPIRHKENWVDISSQYDFPEVSRRRSISDETAHWVCRCLEKGMKPLEILEKTTNKNLTRGIIKTIKRRGAYHHITCDYRF